MKIKPIVAVTALCVISVNPASFVFPSVPYNHKAHPSVGRILSPSCRPFIKKLSKGKCEFLHIPYASRQRSSCDSTMNGNYDNIIDKLEHINHRLRSHNVSNSYFFVNDNDENEKYYPTGKGKGLELCNLTNKYNSCSGDDRVVEVKTLIWEAQILSSRRNSRPLTHQVCSDDTEKSLFFVTALRVEDKIHMKDLKSVILNHVQNDNNAFTLNSNCNVSIKFAKKKTAEKLTGFKSGTMSPFLHDKRIPVFVDSRVIENINKLKVGELVKSKNIGNNRGNLEPMVSVGSGVSDYSLQMSLKDFLYLVNKSRSKSIDNHVKSQKNIAICTITEGNKRHLNDYHENNIITEMYGQRKDHVSHQLTVKKVLCSKRNEFVKPHIDFQNNLNNDKHRGIFQKIARTKGTLEDMERMIEIIGDKFPSLLKVSTYGFKNISAKFNKNALHLAAWKGDIETMDLLIKESKKYSDTLGDIVNMISTGEANMGKTPIFYAITQCRDDVVIYLLTQGANLLIVNNKGQTPTSLATTHLKEETCNILFNTEKQQLESGGTFTNYRNTHSDYLQYGDLDPRFITSDDVNMGDDVLEEIKTYQESFTNGHDTKSSISSYMSSLGFKYLPTSVRKTTRIWSYKPSEIYKESRRATLRKFLGLDAVKEDEGKQTNTEIVSLSQGKMSFNSGKRKSLKKLGAVTSLEGESIEIDRLPTLRLRDVLSYYNIKNYQSYELVNDMDGIRAMRQSICKSVMESNDKEEISPTFSWGLDCEWKPTRKSGTDNPVATLQISTIGKAFLVDLQTICQNNVKNAQASLTPIEIYLSEAIKDLFRSRSLPIVGFGIAQDLMKLAASFPHMDCFHQLHSVLDLHSLSRHIFSHYPREYMSSLQKCVAVLLRKKLDKREQCSAWDARPLSLTQCEYAALDAAVLPILFKIMMDSNASKDFCIKKHPHLLSSHRFIIIGQDLPDMTENMLYRVPMGSVKSVLQLKIARQVWPTKTEAPSLPEQIPLIDINSHKRDGRERDVMKKDILTNVRTLKPKRILLRKISGDLQYLPEAGIRLGYTKDSCIERMLGKKLMNSLPSNFHLTFNRRGGIVELSNAWALFINFGTSQVYGKYSNQFLGIGKQVTFTVDAKRSQDEDLLHCLLASGRFIDKSSIHESLLKDAFLFLRSSTKERFMFCGKCKCTGFSVKGNLVDLVLELYEYQNLKVSSLEGNSPYLDMVMNNNNNTDY